MNARDRLAVDRIDGVIREVGTLTPSNPADIRAIDNNLRIAVTASKKLAEAISALQGQDWDLVDQHLREAEAIVSRPTLEGGSR